MNIALFGGSFDPFHIGHEKIVDLVFAHLDVEKLFIVPTYINPFKDIFFLEPNIRYELLVELFQENTHIEIIDYEIQQKRKVPTIETLEYLVSKYDCDTIYLIIGADNFKTINQWNSFEKLKKMVTFVVFGRDGHCVDEINLEHIFVEIDMPVSSSHIRDTKDLSMLPEKIQMRMKQIWNKE